MHRTLMLVLAVLATVAALPSSAGALVIGVGDQKDEMFSDPLFRALGIRYARLAVSWDALSHSWDAESVDAWLEAARETNVQPLVGFGHSRSNRRSLPTPSRFKYEFLRFRARYPWVTTFATWNEANHCGEPTCHRPELVSGYYRAMRRVCPKCTILAAEVLDTPNMSSWVRAFQHHLGFRPRRWGLHNYVDANRFQTTGTRRLLGLTSGQIWFTETGGIVQRRNKSTVGFEESVAHAARATRWVFDRLAPLSRRITRIYLYQWNPVVPADNWDSALIDRNGRPRPAWRVLRRELQAEAERRSARLSGRRCVSARCRH